MPSKVHQSLCMLIPLGMQNSNILKTLAMQKILYTCILHICYIGRSVEGDFTTPSDLSVIMNFFISIFYKIIIVLKIGGDVFGSRRNKKEIY